MPAVKGQTPMQAIWKDTVIAHSDDTVIVEGNHYFPPESVNMAFLQPSKTRTICPWKGKAWYYTIEVGSDRNTDAAWYYPKTKKTADNIRGRVAFWKGVTVRE